MPKSNIGSLGRKLDNAERALSAIWAADKGTLSLAPDSASLENWQQASHRLAVAKSDYGRALAERHRSACDKFRERKSIVKSGDAFKLRNKRSEAMIRVDEFEDLRPQFVTEREWLDACSASALADAIYDIAQEKYHSEEAAARRRDAADRAANIVRRNPRRTSTEIRL